MKICSKCNIEKDNSMFRCGRSSCKDCEKEYRKINKEKISLQKKKYSKDNEEMISKRQKEYYLKNKELINTQNKQYYENNKELVSLSNKEYYLKNKEKINKRVAKRLQNNPAFKLRKKISHSVGQAIKLQGSCKGNKSILNYLPYTIDELKNHLESLFEPWMNWNNNGTYKINKWNDYDQSTWKWQIDHIVPQSYFKYTSMEDEEFKQCWALENLRPLSAKSNNYKSNNIPSFIEKYLIETHMILSKINKNDIENLAILLSQIRDNKGRLFILGNGGSAGTASHSVNDFRKICGLESYTPTDNVSELTARINDEDPSNCYKDWLAGCNLDSDDAILILSVGGGNIEKNVSMNLVKAIDYAKFCGISVFGVVGKDGGYTKQNADCAVVIPVLNSDRITPHTEGLCSVILHLLVSHPKLKVAQTKWESVV